MTSTQSEQSVDAGMPSAEQVEEYLKRNPQFLAEHEQLLAVLNVPHHVDGGVLSLIERQVEVLKQRNRRLDEQMVLLIEAATENDRLSLRLFETCARMLATENLDDFLTDVLPAIAAIFDVEKVSLRLKDSGPVMLRLGDDEVAGQVWERVSHGRGICDDRLPTAVITLLFGDNSIIRSCALIPFEAAGDRGLIAFGSTDNARFKPDMGTELLDRLGELTGVLMARLLKNP